MGMGTRGYLYFFMGMDMKFGWVWVFYKISIIETGGYVYYLRVHKIKPILKPYSLLSSILLSSLSFQPCNLAGDRLHRHLGLRMWWISICSFNCYEM
ncbi:hypothetical protein RchiOBHm_Chr6g0273751 [Rosa chinensis]|uniref:Uncharacterized protein n=1 Tax=Rosa chinensis TaxID=74649 RepID=A0A2P6PRK3_ROSCH|nr:hypothetical protein RchiOBHm_Chr6g0273751 [Rosa chinensis]